MCDTCLAHFYHDERKPSHDLHSPRMPDPSFIATDPPASLEKAVVRDWLREKQQLEDKVRQLVLDLETVRAERNDLQNQIDNCGYHEDEQVFAHIDADNTGLYVTHIASGKRYQVLAFDEPHMVQGSFLEARAAMCRYAYLQDEECKLPGGHIGEHGPKHQCDVDCGLSEDGCTLPVPANPVAYWKALYWELHGNACPPTCRGHQGG